MKTADMSGPGDARGGKAASWWRGGYHAGAGRIRVGAPPDELTEVGSADNRRHYDHGLATIGRGVVAGALDAMPAIIAFDSDDEAIECGRRTDASPADAGPALHEFARTGRVRGETAGAPASAFEYR